MGVGGRGGDQVSQLAVPALYIILIFISCHMKKLIGCQCFIGTLPVINILIWGMYWLKAQSTEEGWIFQKAGGVNEYVCVWQSNRSVLSKHILRRDPQHNSWEGKFPRHFRFHEVLSAFERVHLKCHCNKWLLYFFWASWTISTVHVHQKGVLKAVIASVYICLFIIN